ncbi:MAG: pitrilysin family protein [Bacteroidia bacterium]
MKKIAVALLFLLAAGWQGLNAQKLIEEVTRTGDEIVIPYKKYKLDNGLTVLIHEDHSDPIVHVDVTYHVGSAREQLGRSGFAHFFEHMMFQGSDNVADEEHFSIVTEAGGTLNGTTNSDRTNYFETVPSNQLETAMWLEADRMGFLLDAVTQQKFEIQRATVKNERGQNYDNRPYGLINERTSEALYPFGHPYSWPTIGYLVDLDRVNVDDLKRFFLRWYGPNNAVLTVAGDINTDDVLKLANKYFGSIPRGPEVKPMAKQAAKLDSDRYISLEDNIRFPMIQMSWPSVPSGDADELPLDMLAELIGGGNTSMLYQTLVKTNKAVQARCYNPCAELAGTFVVNVLPYPGGGTLADMETQIRQIVKDFATRGISDDELARFKNTREADLIQGLQSVSGKASQLAAFETFKGNPNYIKEEIKKLQKLTKEDVMRVYNQYVNNKPCVILSVYPKGQPEIVAKPDNFQIKRSSDFPAEESSEYKNLVYNKAKDSFDRSKKPAAGKNPVIQLPAFTQKSFPNNLRMIAAEDHDLPTVSMVLSIPAGHSRESAEKSGTANLLSDMLNESTEKYSSEEMTAELEKIGSSISVYTDREELVVQVFSLKKNLARTMELLQEKLFHPKFDTEEFETAKSQTIAGIENNATRAASIASNVFNKLLYGDHIFGVPTSGTKESVSGVALDDVKAFYKQYFTPDMSKLVVVGDISAAEAEKAVSFLTSWMGPKLQKQAMNAPPKVEKTKVYFVNKEGAPQSEIRIGYLALPYDAEGEFYRAGLMNYPLGGNFNSRINLTLREKKGYTYGARSYFSGTDVVGPFAASAGVKAEKTDSSLMDFFSEINNYKNNGVTEAELAFTKSSLGQRDALKYETPFQKASFLQTILDYNLDKDFIAKQSAILKSISKNDIDGLAKRYLPTDKMIVVVVGDKASNWDKIAALGYEMIELDIDGNPVK